jgi:3-oxoacyl-[acyl-carrier-protein] synthase-3
MAFPSTSALLADTLGMPDAAAYDLSAGCTGFMYAIAQALRDAGGRPAKRALVVGGDVLSKILDWSDRSTLVLFGDGAGRRRARARGRRRLPRLRARRRRRRRRESLAARLRLAAVRGSRAVREDERPRGVQVRDPRDGQLGTGDPGECGKTVDDIDVYVPHQANVRIIDHAAEKLGVPEEKIVVNVDRYGNTSSGSIPLALADAADDGRLETGKLVLMTGMGAGLTWGSALIEWTHLTTGAAA